MKVPAYAAPSPGAPLAPFVVDRRELRPGEVLVEILFCGICHSDVHQARDEWSRGRFPMVLMVRGSHSH